MIKALFKAFEVRWKSYRHRFVPWIALNLQKNERYSSVCSLLQVWSSNSLGHLIPRVCYSPRTLRQVKDRSQDKLIRDEEVSKSLVCLFTELLRNDLKNQRELLRLLPTSKQNIYTNVESETQDALRTVMLNTLGFVTERKCSSLQLAGTGVFVSCGRAQKGSVVAMYPGILYMTSSCVNVTPHFGNIPDI